MITTTVENRLRLFLLGLAAFMSFGTVIELILEDHFDSLVQLIPFVLSGLALLAVAAVWLRPQVASIWGLRGTMALVGLGSLYGLIEHLESNIEFAREIKPNAALADVFFQALKGASPLLAPGILGLVALIALAATYYHPALNGRL